MGCSFERQKRVSIVHASQKILDSLKKKSNKIWVDQDNEFYNSQFKKFLKGNNIETQNVGESVVGERFIKTLKKTRFLSI